MKTVNLAVLVIACSMAPADAREPRGTKITQVYEHAVPGLPDKVVRGVLVEYEAGGVNAPHYHAPSALIYATVLEGAVLNQLNGGPLRTYTKGENFTELPGDRHDISANASDTEPASLLAVFVVDKNDSALTTPIDHAHSTGAGK